MGNKTPLDERTTDFIGARMDPFHDDLLGKILAKWISEGKKLSKVPIANAGVEFIAKQEGLYPNCHLITGELKPGLWDEEAALREKGYDDDDFVNEGVRSLAAREGLMDRTKTIVSSETKVCEGA